MTRCPMCNQPNPAPPRLSADERRVMLAAQAMYRACEPITAPSVALVTKLSISRARGVMAELIATGWLGKTAWGSVCIRRWVWEPVKPVREWLVTHVPHGAEPPAGAEVSREGLGPHAAHIQGIAYREVGHG